MLLKSHRLLIHFFRSICPLCPCPPRPPPPPSLKQPSVLPECITRSILEVKPSKFVTHQNVTRPEVSVAFLENVDQNFLLRRFWISVTLEVLDGVALHDFSDKLSGFSRVTANAKTVPFVKKILQFSRDARTNKIAQAKGSTTRAASYNASSLDCSIWHSFCSFSYSLVYCKGYSFLCNDIKLLRSFVLLFITIGPFLTPSDS